MLQNIDCSQGVSPRVNGASIRSFIGQQVTLVGKVLNENMGKATLEASVWSFIFASSSSYFELGWESDNCQYDARKSIRIVAFLYFYFFDKFVMQDLR
jgi:hypothetical protein